MGNCIYCDKPAGFFRTRHQECWLRHEEGKDEIISLVGGGLKGGSLSRLETSIRQVASASNIDASTMKSLVVTGWEKAVDDAFDDDMLTNKEETALVALGQHFDLSQEDLDENGAYTKVVKGAVLREILEGKIPEKLHITGNLPFNLQKTEKVVWVFRDVDYYKTRTRTQYVGGSHGVSVRVAKGLYYRVGAFKGERVQNPETIHADTGLLGVTSKHIYFVGTIERFRIGYAKIMAFEAFSDGIGVQRDALTAKPQSFVTEDGWFTYNLITNLAQM